MKLIGSLGNIRSRNGRLRASAVVAFAGKPLKGFAFSRTALEASRAKWIGDPVMLGNHNPGPNLVADFSPAAANPVVGEVVDVHLDADGSFRLIPEFDGRLKAALDRFGFERLEDLPGEVSLEVVPRVIKEEAGVADSEIAHTNGFVLLTEEPGACSRADGCGLRLSASANCCDSCKEKHMANEDPTLTKDDVKSIVQEVLKAQAEAEAQAAEEAKAKAAADAQPSEEVLAKAKAYDALVEKQKGEVIDSLIATGRFTDENREELAKVGVEELQVRLDLVQDGTGQDGDRMAASAQTKAKGTLLSPLFGKARQAKVKGQNSQGVKAKAGDVPTQPTWEEVQAKARAGGEA